ncbi:MAG: ATP-binding protein [Candidatus Thermoplasmatota archaeon]
MEFLVWSYLLTAFVTLSLGLIVYLKGRHKEKNKFFLLFALTGFYWSLTGFGLRQSHSFEEAYLWARIGGFWPLAISAFAHFAIIFSEKKQWFKNKILYLLLYLPAFLFGIIEATTNFISNVERGALGIWTTTPGNAFLYYSSTIWGFVLTILAISLCVKYYLNLEDLQKKHQAKYVILGLSIPVFSAGFNQFFIYTLWFNVPSLTIPGYTLSLVLIGYAIWKHRLFKLSSSAVVDQILSTMSDMLVIIRPDGMIRDVNQRLVENLGYEDKKNLIDQPFNKICNDEDFLDLEKRASRKETTFSTKNGERIPVLFSKGMIEDDRDKARAILIIGKNVSRIKKTEKELKESVKKLKENEVAMISMLEDLRLKQEEIQDLNKNLEEKVEERTKEVEQLLRQKDEFIHMLGHDLKNPLTPLITLLPIIKKKTDDPHEKELLDISIKNVNFMKNLVTKTLKLARLNSPNTHFDLEKTDLIEEINKTLETNKMMFKENNIQVENLINNDYKVKADKLRLNELLNNLLINSVKYTPEKGKITIDAEKIDKKDEIKISIHDNGLGMTEEQTERIFDEFYKTDESRHDFDSSGLGLPICKRIVEKHGGHIWAESDGPNKGTTFNFTLKTPKK